MKIIVLPVPVTLTNLLHKQVLTLNLKRPSHKLMTVNAVPKKLAKLKPLILRTILERKTPIPNVINATDHALNTSTNL